MTSVLTAEQYRDFPDPQYNTHVQRSWVYGKENAIDVADKKLEHSAKGMCQANGGNSEGVLAKYKRDYMGVIGADKLTSLPIEDGERAFFPKIDAGSNFRKIRSNVNLGNGAKMEYR